MYGNEVVMHEKFHQIGSHPAHALSLPQMCSRLSLSLSQRRSTFWKGNKFRLFESVCTWLWQIINLRGAQTFRQALNKEGVHDNCRMSAKQASFANIRTHSWCSLFREPSKDAPQQRQRPRERKSGEIQQACTSHHWPEMKIKFCVTKHALSLSSLLCMVLLSCSVCTFAFARDLIQTTNQPPLSRTAYICMHMQREKGQIIKNRWQLVWFVICFQSASLNTACIMPFGWGNVTIINKKRKNKLRRMSEHK